jgi:hypothetical protein
VALPLLASTEEGPLEDTVRGGCPQLRKRGLTRNQPCLHLDLGLPASRTVRKYISAV